MYDQWEVVLAVFSVYLAFISYNMGILYLGYYMSQRIRHSRTYLHNRRHMEHIKPLKSHDIGDVPLVIGGTLRPRKPTTDEYIEDLRWRVNRLENKVNEIILWINWAMDEAKRQRPVELEPPPKMTEDISPKKRFYERIEPESTVYKLTFRLEKKLDGNCGDYIYAFHPERPGAPVYWDLFEYLQKAIDCYKVDRGAKREC